MRRSLLMASIAAAAAMSLAVLAVPRDAVARSSLRCGNRLVSDGEHMDQVLRRCGEPTFRDLSTEFVSFETPAGFLVTKEIAVETWTYNLGPRKFVRYLSPDFPDDLRESPTFARRCSAASAGTRT